jgi:hypothetical protein
MKQFLGVGALLLLFLIPTRAQETPPSGTQTPSSPPQTPPSVPQTPPSSARETPRYEVSAGYNLRVFTQPNYARVGFNGWYGAGEYNILERISLAGEVSGGFRNQGARGDLSIYSGMVGPQIYPFKHAHKITPFAHVLFGEGYYRASYPAFGGFPAEVVTYSSFSWEVGGGVDIRRTPHWSIRLIQLDYARTGFLGSKLVQNNYRASIGFVYRFGKR